MAKAHRIKTGDVFVFTPDGGEPVATWVLFVSKKFRDVILLGVIQLNGASLKDSDFESQMDREDAYRIYTIGSEVAKYWDLNGNISVPDELIDKYSYRLVGWDVVRRDETIRKASRDEVTKKEIPQMGVCGLGIVERRLIERFVK